MNMKRVKLARLDSISGSVGATLITKHLSFLAGAACIAAQLSAASLLSSNATLPLPPAAEWNLVVPFRPGDGETVSLNPPRFSWCYTPTPQTAATDRRDLTFRLQLSYESNFTSSFLDLTNDSNLFNALAPLQTNQAVFWRVGYIVVTNGSFLGWSATRRFTVAPGATEWDRSLYTNETWLASAGAHPHFLFRATNRAAVLAWLETNEPVWWPYNKTFASNILAESWWTNAPSRTHNYNDPAKALKLATVALVRALTQESHWTNYPGPQDHLEALAQYFTDHFLDQKDINLHSDMLVWQALAYGYDWLYQDMTAAQRSNVLFAIESACAAGRCHLFKTPVKFDNGTGNLDTNRVYAGPYSVSYWHGGKQFNSHAHLFWTAASWMALAGLADGPRARELFEHTLHYLIGKTYPLGGEGGFNQGRGYLAAGVFLKGSLLNYLNYAASLPELHLERSPFWKTNADWVARLLPVGWSEQNDPWGDDGPFGRVNYWNRRFFGRDLALFTQSGAAYQHHLNELALAPDDSANYFDELLFPYHFPPPAPVTNTALANAYLEEGWVMGASAPVNTHEAFTNGVGFIFQARPRGAQSSQGTGHAHLSDLSYQLWAYGAPITDAGDAPMNKYAKVAWAHYTLLVDGLGQAQWAEAPLEPYYCRLLAFTNGAHFTYCAADATRAYARSNFAAGGWIVPSQYAALHSGGPLAKVTKVQRHLLFARRKYFVVYDDLAATRNSTFTMVYQVPWVYSWAGSNYNMMPKAPANGLNLATPHRIWWPFWRTNELPSTANGELLEVWTNSLGGTNLCYRGNVYETNRWWEGPLGSNSVTLLDKASFSYEANSVPTAQQTNTASVTTYVYQVVDPALLAVTNMSGTSVRKNPITGEDYGSQSGAHPRGSVFWISNRNPTTNFHFLTVIYPTKPGEAAPTITRIDDWTVAVTNSAGTEGDLISFDTNRTNATLLVDLAGVVAGSQSLDAPIDPPADTTVPITPPPAKPAPPGAMTKLFDYGDFTNPIALVAKIRAQADPVSQFLWEQFTPSAKAALSVLTAKPADVGTTLSTEMNRIIRSGTIYDSQRFAAVVFSAKTRSLLTQRLEGAQLVRFNRMLIEDAYPQEIGPSEN
ncbi:MAG: heparinase II/III family protein [Verrucomicrobia bacterium]|nr:heparinase II/III family protein [Verrucomicrobiota bacterium]